MILEGNVFFYLYFLREKESFFNFNVTFVKRNISLQGYGTAA
jgi:hypothetical protein